MMRFIPFSCFFVKLRTAHFDYIKCSGQTLKAIRCMYLDYSIFPLHGLNGNHPLLTELIHVNPVD